MSHNANGEPDIIGNVETNANGVDGLSEPLDVDTLESKKETYIWNKGAWLSFCVNIKSQWDYLGNAILIYEARGKIQFGVQKPFFMECRRTRNSESIN